MALSTERTARSPSRKKGRLAFPVALAFPALAAVAVAVISGRSTSEIADRTADGATPTAGFPVSGGVMSSLAGMAATRGGALVAPSGPPPIPRQALLTQERECPPYSIQEPPRVPHRGFYFTRGAYSENPYNWGGRSWSVDFNKADRQFLVVMQRLMNMDIFPCENPVRLDNPHLSRFPFVYMLEVGGMWLTPAEVENFRDYLLRGGFAMIDDFWGDYAWQNFEREIKRVLPEYPIVDIPMDHLIFRIVYPVREVLTVPNEGNGCRGDPSRYSESGGEAVVRGIFDDAGRLMVVIAFDTDLGDAWEWAELTCYPWERANYAFQFGFNLITYAMTN